MQTDVTIIGAGPAGLLLSHLLHLEGISSVIIESRSREAIEATIRAGVLEQSTTDLLTEIGAGDRMKKEGFVHTGFDLHFSGRSHRIDLEELTGGRVITVYPQHEVLKDLIALRLATGADIRFEHKVTAVDDLTSDAPVVRFTDPEGIEHTLTSKFIAGCDGGYGVSKQAIPVGTVRTDYFRDYAFGWFGILANAPPSSEELIYANSPRGFALISTRSQDVQRMYFQCDPKDSVDNWDEKRIWQELQARVEGRSEPLKEGPIFQKNIVPLRSLVTEPMQYGRLFLAGDAAHSVPPTGAKGLNLAASDVFLLARGLASYFATGADAQLQTYSTRALRRVWRAQHFSWWMTSMLHRFEGTTGAVPFDGHRQLAELDAVTSSPAAAKFLAEMYAGLPFG